MPTTKVLEPFVEAPEDVPEQPLQPFMKRRGTRWIIAGVVLVLLVGAFLVWLHYSRIESTDDAQIEGDIVPISSRVGGTVRSVRVEDNQIVKAGDVLVEIDPVDYEVALRRAQADLADADASAKGARSNVPITTTNTASQTETARAALAAAEQ